MMLQHGLSEDTSYTINQSLRFRASNSANLSRAYTSNATWTFSAWIKRGALGVISPLFGDAIKFNANDTLTAMGLTTTAVFRDPSAWYHIHVSNGGLYVNGVSFGAVTTSAQTNTKIGTNNTNYFDGYIAHPYFIDSTSSSYTNFGQVDVATGIWVPKPFSGAYGTTGGFWPFNDATSLTTLGYDRSGNGNNWTCNGISVTAGATYDVMKDSPTNGAGEVGNYATLNPLGTDRGTPVLSAANLTNGDTASSGTWGASESTIRVTTGKWYFESTGSGAITTTPATNSSIIVSVVGSATPGSIPGTTTPSVGYITSGEKYVNGTASAYGASYTTSVIGCAFDADARTVEFYRDGVSQGVISIGASSIGYTFAVGAGWGGAGAPFNNVNFGQQPFAYTPPTGFKPLHTGNLSATTPVTTSGTFTGNASTYGPCIFINGTPTAMTINGNAVTFATHADKLAGGFKVRSSSASYNAAGTNTYSITTNSGKFKNARAQANP